MMRTAQKVDAVKPDKAKPGENTLFDTQEWVKDPGLSNGEGSDDSLAIEPTSSPDGHKEAEEGLPELGSGDPESDIYESMEEMGSPNGDGPDDSFAIEPTVRPDGSELVDEGLPELGSGDPGEGDETAIVPRELEPTGPATPITLEVTEEELECIINPPSEAELAAEEERKRSRIKEKLLSGLNTQQREAVTTTEGPLWVVAGAGSGKTRVLTHRVAYLIRYCNVDPENILAITFTNKAANEMKQRVKDLTDKRPWEIWVSTIHSACTRILREDAPLLINPGKKKYKRNFTIYDQDDSVRLTKRVMGMLGVDRRDFSPRKVTQYISNTKNHLVAHPTNGEYDDQEVFRYLGQEGAEIGWREVVPDILRRYQREMLGASAMDYDDLLLNTVRLFTQNQGVLQKYQRKFSYVLVDEFQDTNRIQYQFVRQLTLGNKHSDGSFFPQGSNNLAIVGDIDQSIYGFRGARIQNLAEFETDFPDRKVVLLEQNYRSTERILQAANAVISHIPHKHRKTLWSELGPGEKLIWYKASDDRDEANFVCAEIERLLKAGDYDLTNIAVLYRTNSQSRLFEEMLAQHYIPYQVLGSLRFWERLEIKNAMAYLQFIRNPADEIALNRIYNTPPRGIGASTNALISNLAEQKNISRWEVMNRADEFFPGDVRGRKAVSGFVQLMLRMMELLNTEPPDVPTDILTQLAEIAVNGSGYRKYLEEKKTIESNSRIDNLEQLVDVAAEFDHNQGGVDISEEEWMDLSGLDRLAAFLDKYALTSDVDQLDSNDEMVTLMTLHTVKGLEYPVVFIVGMEEGIFPHQFSVEKEAEYIWKAEAKKRAAGQGVYDIDDRFDYQAAAENQIAEERRLAYVGITRAQERLYLTSAKRRMWWGSLDNHRIPSRFLSEIPKELIQVKKSKQQPVRRNYDLRISGRGGHYSEDDSSGDATSTSGVSGAFSVNSRVRAKASGPNDVSSFQVGSKVKHSTWGIGVISSVSGEGNRMQADVRFRTGGTKKLLVAYAPLHLVD